MGNGCEWAMNKPSRLPKLGILALCAVVTAYIFITSRSSSLLPNGLFGAHSPENHCAHILPILPTEFHERQQHLAETLYALNASAYITEPGPSALFYANISTAHWRLSERPLLLVVTPEFHDDRVEARVTVVAPKFEITRAKNLVIPAQVQFLDWPEDGSPYEVAITTLPQLANRVFVDSSIRHFLVEGLQSALRHGKVVSAPTEIVRIRERKSASELEIMRCANEATVLAIRDVHKRMYIGMREFEAREMIAASLKDVGLSNGGCLTLFGENAALPHGSGSGRVLGKADFALFDCTAFLHGYASDVTRTVALPGSQIPGEHLNIWNLVFSAQQIALSAVANGTLTRKADEAARSFLTHAGYGQYFTHRLGHGIGLEGHEQPYLRGKSNDIIQTGHTFSNEPGIYIEGSVGVRIEDCFFIDDSGKAIYFTEGVGAPTRSPWLP